MRSSADAMSTKKRASCVACAGPEYTPTASPAYCAFAHPESIGNVLSESGSYWITKDWQNVRPPYPRDTGMMIDAFKLAKRLPIRFYFVAGTSAAAPATRS